MKKILFLIFIIYLGTNSFAQDTTVKRNTKAEKKAEKRQRINAIIKQEEEGNLSFTKQTAIGISLRTNGYGAFIEMGRRKSARYSNTYLLEITEKK